MANYTKKNRKTLRNVVQEVAQEAFISVNPAFLDRAEEELKKSVTIDFLEGIRKSLLKEKKDREDKEEKLKEKSKQNPTPTPTPTPTPAPSSGSTPTS